ncbi:hypothetical protein L596_020948 [Steinernema carpocapsae]|uniref:Uncharacterized protein n=1 Tax=Steinernema carpocapsae TaxID=34508 RepID=A0A4U5MVS3_STECR|nr:hypothetical protein L596_020948 [Steinernema carpocapsae]
MPASDGFQWLGSQRTSVELRMLFLPECCRAWPHGDRQKSGRIQGRCPFLQDLARDLISAFRYSTSGSDCALQFARGVQSNCQAADIGPSGLYSSREDCSLPRGFDPAIHMGPHVLAHVLEHLHDIRDLWVHDDVDLSIMLFHCCT